MSSCTRHGIKINWKGYKNCPACEHIKMETTYVRQDTAEEIKQLQADLARCRRGLELATEAYCQLQRCVFCPANGLCDLNTLDYSVLIKHFTAKAAAEIEDAPARRAPVGACRGCGKAKGCAAYQTWLLAQPKQSTFPPPIGEIWRGPAGRGRM